MFVWKICRRKPAWDRKHELLTGTSSAGFFIDWCQDTQVFKSIAYHTRPGLRGQTGRTGSVLAGILAFLNSLKAEVGNIIQALDSKCLLYLHLCPRSVSVFRTEMWTADPELLFFLISCDELDFVLTPSIENLLTWDLTISFTLICLIQLWPMAVQSGTINL